MGVPASSLECRSRPLHPQTHVTMPGMLPQKSKRSIPRCPDDSTWHEELVLNWIAKSTFHLHSQQLELTCATTTFQGQPFPIKGHMTASSRTSWELIAFLELKAVEHFTLHSLYAEGITRLTISYKWSSIWLVWPH